MNEALWAHASVFPGEGSASSYWLPFPLSPHTQFGCVTPGISEEVDVLFILNNFYDVHFSFGQLRIGKEKAGNCADLMFFQTAKHGGINGYEPIMSSFETFNGRTTSGSQTLEV